MKKGNFRTKKIGSEKGKVQFVIETKVLGKWKLFPPGDEIFVFETQEKADAALISIFDFGSQMNQQVNLHGIDLENLKTRG